MQALKIWAVSADRVLAQDGVSFEPDGHEAIGIIVRLNRKSVTVVTTEGAHWRVAPALIKRLPADVIGLADADAKLLAKVQGELIEWSERQ